MRVGSFVLVSCLVCAIGCGGPSLPRSLTSTVHRTEEQGIDFSSTGSVSLEIELDGSRARATLATRAVDVSGSDVHEENNSVVYDVAAPRDGARIVLALSPHADAPRTARAVTLVCEPWTETERAIEAFEALPSEGGVAWACALLENETFALGRVAIEHLPREGRAYVLMSETHSIVIDEDVNGAGRTVRLRADAPPRP